ncbi:hypothetical protein [Deinococcus cavernae]|uniref:hypothetical protein n=1 Tax=Deinococcus cavernae TaxID=2320857 RepID=UPI0011C21C69|nr:hypothetical protein [Deinococcus cavernae]
MRNLLVILSLGSSLALAQPLAPVTVKPAWTVKDMSLLALRQTVTPWCAPQRVDSGAGYCFRACKTQGWFPVGGRRRLACRFYA